MLKSVINYFKLKYRLWQSCKGIEKLLLKEFTIDVRQVKSYRKLDFMQRFVFGMATYGHMTAYRNIINSKWNELLKGGQNPIVLNPNGKTISDKWCLSNGGLLKYINK